MGQNPTGSIQAKRAYPFGGKKHDGAAIALKPQGRGEQNPHFCAERRADDDTVSLGLTTQWSRLGSILPPLREDRAASSEFTAVGRDSPSDGFPTPSQAGILASQWKRQPPTRSTSHAQRVPQRDGSALGIQLLARKLQVLLAARRGWPSNKDPNDMTMCWPTVGDGSGPRTLCRRRTALARMGIKTSGRTAVGGLADRLGRGRNGPPDGL